MAAVELGRVAHAAEINPAFFKGARTRLEDAVRRTGSGTPSRKLVAA